MVGYCWGGAGFMHAVNGGAPGFGGAVGYYGLPYMNGAVPIADSLAKIRVPGDVFNGSKDARIGAAMPAVDSVMKRLGQDYTSTELRRRDARLHALAGRPKATRDLAEEAANLAATKDAWPKTVEFFSGILE